mmetsp:Transcript_14366/g.33446  ORF Transcript_14366/g.33446 Transcript_14366/m.33446 type:complete len:789 (-) Transcript_14366:297-2663(-)
MDCNTTRQPRSERDPMSARDGGESDGEIQSEQQQPAAAILIVNPPDSEVRRESLLPRPLVSLLDERPAMNDSTTRMVFPPLTRRQKGCRDCKRGGGCSSTVLFFVFFALILLLSAIISVEVISDRSSSSSSSDYNLIISREDFDAYDSSLFALVQRGSQQRRRYLQNASDPDINPANSTDDPIFDPSLTPEIVVNTTDAPSFFPSQSFQPTHSPTVTPQPSPQPTSDSLAPTEHPTHVTSISASLVPSASTQPSNAPYVTPYPTLSLSPTLSFSPSAIFTSAFFSRTANKTDNKMVLENVPDDALGSAESILAWAEITSEHIASYYFQVKSTYPNHWLFNLTGVKTIGIVEASEEDDESPTSRQDGSGDPPYRSLTITYNQSLTFDSEEDNPNVSELFKLPFESDSFQYSVDLTKGMNWSNLIVVQFDAGEIEIPQRQEPQPILRITQRNSIIISFAIVVGSCLIVLVLLWERRHKGDGNAAMNLRRNMPSSDNSVTQGNRGPNGPGEWNPMSLNNSSVTSAHSAPGNLRRNKIAGGGTRLSSKDIISIPTHSRASSNSSNIEINSNNQENSPKPKSVEVNRGSPDIPQQVKTSLRVIGNSERSGISTTSTIRSASNRPFLPPLPRPSSFSSTSHERRRTGDSLESSSVYEHIPLNDQTEDAIGRHTFRLPSSGRSFGLRINHEDNVSELTRSYPSNSGYFSTEDFLPLSSSPNADSNLRQAMESPFMSPLHIPGEEALGLEAANPLPSPESPVPTMLGLESRPVDDPLKPVRAGFEMKVEHIQDIDA